MWVRFLRWLGFRAPAERLGAPLAHMTPVPGGRVVLDGRPRRVRSFQLDERPVTNHEYAAFVKATGARRPAWMHKPGFGDPEQPVVGVTWPEALRYARWAGKRLPTEREWLRAARGDDQRRYPWGNAPPEPARAHFNRKKGAPAPVEDAGDRHAGIAPFGHRDLCGNVWEWCSEGVLRGGFWGAPTVSIDQRLVDKPDRISGGYGFRCAR